MRPEDLVLQLKVLNLEDQLKLVYKAKDEWEKAKIESCINVLNKRLAIENMRPEKYPSYNEQCILDEIRRLS
jgi:hypothetical protein